ncbi:FxsA family protein [Parvularcula dongshanensis]|uniref:UPF0716 protein FxsA n=1 Tax=Parvularcula dongshanensis TaxID=1173995 RepID=A0A840I1W7_9PROT|nr:FxsA family protein [Parvularcula dongshanensis]MBB4658234.1 UPF0716 protein FxsA [Parvularcula dongshanensis]
MFVALILLLLVLPIVEIALIVEVGQATNWLVVVLMTIGTAALGAFVLKRQGLGVARDYRRTVRSGQVPVGPTVDGAGLLLAAPLLMTPGFVTDAMGFALLIPFVRRELARVALRGIKRKIDRGEVRVIRR